MLFAIIGCDSLHGAQEENQKVAESPESDSGKRT